MYAKRLLRQSALYVVIVGIFFTFKDKWPASWIATLGTILLSLYFVPALWLYAHVVNPTWAAGFGVVYLVGRFVYYAAYLKDPKGRSLGFMLTFIPIAIMLLWALVVTVMKLF